jgi:hypothetical protein
MGKFGLALTLNCLEYNDKFSMTGDVSQITYKHPPIRHINPIRIDVLKRDYGAMKNTSTSNFKFDDLRKRRKNFLHSNNFTFTTKIINTRNNKLN